MIRMQENLWPLDVSKLFLDSNAAGTGPAVVFVEGGFSSVMKTRAVPMSGKGSWLLLNSGVTTVEIPLARLGSSSPVRL